jgi:large subunit ribosomal protein L46
MCSPLIARPPLLTREPTSFEKAYYLYQKRLNERLVLPFTRYFYYKKGTPADLEWKRKYKVRRVAARDIGFYNAYDPNAWNDEVLVGSQLSEPADFVEKLCRDAEGKPIVDIAKDVSQEKVAELAADELGSGKRVVEEEKVESEADDIDVLTGESVKKTEKKIVIPRPLPRETEADRTNDLKSLNRKLDRSLYLLIKRKDGQWRFPEDRLYGRENLHQVRRASPSFRIPHLSPSVHPRPHTNHSFNF